MTEKEFLKSIGKEDYIFPYFRSKKEALEEVRHDGYSLRYCPESIMDKDIILEVVKENGYSLQFCPESLMDKDIIMEAIKEDEDSLQYVKHSFFKK